MVMLVMMLRSGLEKLPESFFQPVAIFRFMVAQILFTFGTCDGPIIGLWTTVQVVCLRGARLDLAGAF
jgi:hypothetical protein